MFVNWILQFTCLVLLGFSDSFVGLLLVFQAVLGLCEWIGVIIISNSVCIIIFNYFLSGIFRPGWFGVWTQGPGDLVPCYQQYDWPHPLPHIRMAIYWSACLVEDTTLTTYLFCLHQSCSPLQDKTRCERGHLLLEAETSLGNLKEDLISPQVVYLAINCHWIL